MPLSPCHTTVDSQGRELVQHGTVAFPIACYHDDLSREEVPWHWHEELEAAVITSGYATVAAGNEKYLIGPGQGFFINSGILHGCWDVDLSGCRFHSMVFHPRLVGGSLDSVFYRDYVQPLTENPALEGLFLSPDIPWQRSALEAIESVWQSCVRELSGYEFQVRTALSQLIFLLHRNLPATRRTPSGKALRDGLRIKQMLDFIHSHYSDELTMERIAHSASISQSECLRCFRATIGTTPIQYVRQYRIQQSCLLLTATRDKIADIAVRCGFPDISYFTKTFREARGMTPSEYRKTHQKP